MKTISPLDPDHEARNTWEQGQAAAQSAHPETQTTQDEITMPSQAATPTNEPFLKPVDMTGIYPTVDVTSHAPPSTGSISHDVALQSRDLLPERAPLWVTAGVYLLGGLQLLSLVQLFLSGATPSFIDALGAILTGALAFGLLSWREIARKAYLVLALIIIGGMWVNVYRIDTSMRTSQARFESEVERLESKTPAMTSQERRQLDQVKERIANTTSAYNSNLRPKLIRIAVMTTAVSTAAVVFLFLPRVRGEFS
jgi:hypothetical protein